MKNRLLLVNDQEPLQEIFAAMLAETGWQIEPAFNGDEALRFYPKRGPYDLVLTDIQHPGADGIEVVKRIRETNPAQAIAVVAACAAEARSIRHRFKIPMLPLPCEREQLRKLVESVPKPQLRMLLVAGDPAVKPLTAAYWNFEIEVESTGNRALEHYRKCGPYDIVVTGYRQRGLNGVDLALAIRRVNPAQRVVLITAESSDMVRSMRRKLQGFHVMRLKKLIDAMLKVGQTKIAAARARERSLPSSVRKRFREMTDRWTPMEQAFSELSCGGAQALLDLLDAASHHAPSGGTDRRCSVRSLYAEVPDVPVRAPCTKDQDREVGKRVSFMTEDKEGMTKQLGPDDFGYGWSQEKLLCYWVRCDVIEALGGLELLQESEPSPQNSKLTEHMLKRIRKTAEQADQLFKVICEKERSRTP